jgi:hypothetical protein
VNDRGRLVGALCLDIDMSAGVVDAGRGQRHQQLVIVPESGQVTVALRMRVRRLAVHHGPRKSPWGKRAVISPKAVSGPLRGDRGSGIDLSLVRVGSICSERANGAHWVH